MDRTNLAIKCFFRSEGAWDEQRMKDFYDCSEGLKKKKICKMSGAD